VCGFDKLSSSQGILILIRNQIAALNPIKLDIQDEILKTSEDLAFPKRRLHTLR